MSPDLSLSHSLLWFCSIGSILRYCVLGRGYLQAFCPLRFNSGGKVYIPQSQLSRPVFHCTLFVLIGLCDRP